jgi:hypothetical protein
MTRTLGQENSGVAAGRVVQWGTEGIDHQVFGGASGCFYIFCEFDAVISIN